jgi:hypothetical protein
VTDKLIRLISRDGVVDSLWMWPVLHLKTTKLDTAGVGQPDSLRLLPSGDMYLLRNDSSNVSGRVVIGRGAVYRTVIKYDYSTLRALADRTPVVVNKAYLTLYRDRNRYPWAVMTPGVNAGFLWNDGWLTKPDSVYATFGSSAGIDSTSDSLQIDVTAQMFSYIRKDNFGIVVRGEFEGTQIDRIAFYSSTDPDSARRPKMTVYYTEFPQ